MPYARGIFLACTLHAIAFGGAAQDKAPVQTPANPAVEAKSSSSTPPAKFAFSIELRYCIAPGFAPTIGPTLLSGTHLDRKTCPDIPKKLGGGQQENVGSNLSDIVSALATNTEYAVKAAGDSILAFCKVKECPRSDEERLKNEIVTRLARPHPAYFEDVHVGPAHADELVAAIPGLGGGITARRISDSSIRLETDQRQEPFETKQLLAQIQKAAVDPKTLPKPKDADALFAADRISLPSFCVSAKLNGPQPVLAESPDKCSAGTEFVQANNAKDVAQGLTSSKVSVTSDSPTSIIISCGGAACDKGTFNTLRGSVQVLARPIPAYFQDFDVPPETASAIAGQVQGWNSSITAEVRSNHRVRLKSDTPVSGTDLDFLQKDVVHYGFGAADTQPLWRLFYTNPGPVVSSLAGNAPASSPLAPGLTAPLTGNPPPAPPSPAPAASSSGSTSTNSASGSSASSSSGTGTSTTNGSPAAPAAAPAATSPAPAPVSSSSQNIITAGMVSVGDQVVFTDPLRANATDAQRVQLLTLLDLPRPEVLLNMWSLQENSPDAREVSRQSEQIRQAVSANNDALQNTIEYGWAYLSRRMREESAFFDQPFYNYITQRFVADDPSCSTDPNASPCLSTKDRQRWDFCPAGTYCLGYVEAFQPLHATLTNILLGIMAANDPFKAAFTTIGCMEGKYEVYGDVCFPEHQAIANLLPPPPARPDGSDDKTCIVKERAEYLKSSDRPAQPSCEDLDMAALHAQRRCRLPRAVPLSCFSIQAAKSFLPYHGFSTFTVDQLNNLAETPIADLKSKLPANEDSFSTTPIGLLRAATVDFLFNYKMAQEFPFQFNAYNLTHSAQELNAEFNPLIVAFNQDVATFTREMMDQTQAETNNRRFGPWHNHRSFIADGVITVRGISGVESLVDTDTQSSFNAPQFQSLSSALNSLTGSASAAPATSAATTSQPTSNGTPTIIIGNAPPTPAPAAAAIPNILAGTLSPASIAPALAAISPVAANVQIGRQLALDVTPHTLPGASSAELDVKLWAQEDSSPTLYSDNGASPSTSPLSRVARHNVFTRVRVESIKLFDVSSFSALVQRPRNKIPLVPPLIEVPLIGDLLGIPLPGAKVYYRSTAIVSAIIVPTAADLAYGIQFTADRAALQDGAGYSFHRIKSMDQIPDPLYLAGFHHAMVNCLATRGWSAIPSSQPKTPCNALDFHILPPDRR